MAANLAISYLRMISKSTGGANVLRVHSELIPWVGVRVDCIRTIYRRLGELIVRWHTAIDTNGCR